MAVVGAVVHVVGAVDAGQDLEEEAGFVGGATTDVEEDLLGWCLLQLGGDTFDGLLPTDAPIAGVQGTGVEGPGEPARRLELPGTHPGEAAEIVVFEEVVRYGSCHVGGHGLDGLLAHFGEVAGLVDHPAELAAHPQGAGLAGVAGPQRPVHGNHTSRLAGLGEGIPNGGEAPSCADLPHPVETISGNGRGGWMPDRRPLQQSPAGDPSRSPGRRGGLRSPERS